MSQTEHTSKKSPPPKTVSLILGSGGARGMAHIGVIRWLEAHNYQINSISGSSIGALIGGIYAAGKLDECEAWCKQLSKADIIGLTDFAWDRSGLIKGDKLVQAFKKLIGNPNIEDLSIPFTAVATDLENEKEVWLQKGSLVDAIRASTALPMIFTPFQKNSTILVDGGVLNPVPMAPVFGQANDLMIAVNLGGKPVVEKRSETNKQAEPPEHSDVTTEASNGSWLTGASGLLDSLWSKFRSTELKESSESDLYASPLVSRDMIEISNQAFDSMQNSIARQQLAAYPPDIVVEIPRNACGMLEFTRVSEMIQLGYQAAEEALGAGQPPSR